MRNRVFPERRRHIRIVTLRNFAWFTMVSLLLFAAISLQSELRGRRMQDHGRLTGRQVETTPVEKPVEVIPEATPAQSTPAQTMTIVPAEPQPQPQPLPTTMAMPVAPPQGGDSRVVIVGGPEGVTIVREPRRRPLLAGGFGRN